MNIPNSGRFFGVITQPVLIIMMNTIYYQLAVQEYGTGD